MAMRDRAKKRVYDYQSYHNQGTNKRSRFNYDNGRQSDFITPPQGSGGRQAEPIRQTLCFGDSDRSVGYGAVKIWLKDHDLAFFAHRQNPPELVKTMGSIKNLGAKNADDAVREVEQLYVGDLPAENLKCLARKLYDAVRAEFYNQR